MAFNGANGRDHAWTHEEAIDAGLAWVERHGEPPTRTELDPALMRPQIKKAEERLEQLREREGRFEPGETPGMAEPGARWCLTPAPLAQRTPAL